MRVLSSGLLSYRLWSSMWRFETQGVSFSDHNPQLSSVPTLLEQDQLFICEVVGVFDHSLCK
jgi:hypothetical protein